MQTSKERCVETHDIILEAGYVFTCLSRRAYSQQLIANNQTLQRGWHSNNGCI